MIAEIDEANATQLRQWWVKIPKTLYKSAGLKPEDEEAQRLIYDEIAGGLSNVDDGWVDFLTGFIDANDVNRRCSALFFLTNAGMDTDAVKAALDSAFKSKNLYLKGTALQGYIQINYFPLIESDFDTVNDEWLSAWGMKYMCKAYPRQKIEILEDALKSKNPLERSFACDIIGSELIEHLKPQLKPLLKDKNEHVAEAAAYIYHEILD